VDAGWYREPVLKQQDAGAHQHAFDFRALAHEFKISGRVAKPHDAFNSRAVVPGAVKQDDFTGRGQVIDVTLEVPLRLLGNRGFFQCHDSCATGIEVFHEALYRAALTGCIPALKQNHNLLAGIFDPFLHL
jgi:hypothetical protein